MSEPRPTQGHKIPPARARIARRMELVNADSGERLDRSIDDRLRTAVADHLANREKAHGIAVGVHARASEMSGHLGGGLYLNDPAIVLRRVFGVN